MLDMLDYEAKPRRYQSTPEDRCWLLRRLSYYLALLVVLVLIVVRPGPNLFLFHSLFSPTPAYYAAIAQERYTTTIAAIKAYQLDHGALPEDTYALRGIYLPQTFDERGTLYGATFVTFELPGHSAVIAYEFTPAREGWSIFAPRYYGRLPAPLVAPGPSTRPFGRFY